MRRLLFGVVCAAAFAVSAAPSEASCLAAIKYHGQLYMGHGTGQALPGAPLAERAEDPRCNDSVVISVGEKRPRKPPPQPPRLLVVQSIDGVSPAVAVQFDGQVYTNPKTFTRLPFYSLLVAPGLPRGERLAWP